MTKTFRTIGSFLLVLLFSAVSVHALDFGTGLDNVDTLREKGADIKYGQYWIGHWVQNSGWGGFKSAMKTAKEQNIVPVIQWYYWGDDISPKCIENGCGSYKGGQKNKDTWYKLAYEAADIIAKEYGTDREVLIVIETEFNKNGVQDYEAFDGMMVAQQKIFKDKLPNAKIVVGFGSWGTDKWKNFDQTIAGADYIGYQFMRSSVREGSGDYYKADAILKDRAEFIQRELGKPSFVTDIAISSYGEGYTEHQRAAIEKIMNAQDELDQAGVKGIIYRSVFDVNMGPNEYHKEAEDHWGLMRQDKSEKPALKAFVDGTKKRSTPQQPEVQPQPVRQPVPQPVPEPSVPSGESFTFKGHEVSEKSTGGYYKDSDSEGWNIWTDGSIKQRVNVPTGGKYTFAVKAKGTPAENQWPIMRMKVDDAVVKELSIDGTHTRSVDTGIDLQPGMHTLVVEFTNDAMLYGEDRNLYVSELSLTKVVEATEQPTVSSGSSSSSTKKKKSSSSGGGSVTTVKKPVKEPVIVRAEKKMQEPTYDEEMIYRKKVKQSPRSSNDTVEMELEAKKRFEIPLILKKIFSFWM